MNALNNQIGGNHYKSMQMQPIELISKLKLNYFQGNIVKYISRDKTDKIEDLEKAKHYCQLAIELDKVNKLKDIIYQKNTHKKIVKEIIRYRRENFFDEGFEFICFAIYRKDYKEVIKKINIYIANETEKQKELEAIVSRMCNKNATKGGIEIIAKDNKGIPEELKRKISLITKDYLDKENSLKNNPVIFTKVTREELDGKRLICYNHAKE